MRIVCIEGPDGSGKTTLVRELYDELYNEMDVHVVHEPGGTDIGEEVYKLFSRYRNDLSDLSQAFLVNASRAILFEDVEDWLCDGLLILDRYVPSTLVYQSKVDTDFLYRMSMFASCGCVPDRTYIMDLGVEELHGRLVERDGNASRYEIRKQLDGYGRVVRYLESREWEIVIGCNKEIILCDIRKMMRGEENG